MLSPLIIKITIYSILIGFEKLPFFTNSLAKLLSDSLLMDSLLLHSLLSDSLISQSLSKMQFKSTNHIQSCNYVCVRALASNLGMFTPPLSVFQCEFSPFFVTWLFFFFPETVIFMISNSNWTEWSTIQRVIARVISKSDEREARGRFEITNTITPFITSILKSLVILALWLVLSSAIYSQIAPFFALNRIFSSPKKNGTVKQTKQSDFKVSLT